MRRREFITLLGGAVAAWPLAARAQQAERLRRVGFLFAGTLALRPQAQEFWRRLHELGYIEGKNVVIEVREARGKIEELPKLAYELVSTRTDVLVPVTTPGVAAAKNATQSIPIVMAIVADPLGAGFVKNLGRPEANITGPSYTISPDIVSKRMELFKEMLPERSVIGILWSANNRLTADLIPVAERAGRSLDTPTLSLSFEGPADLKAGLERALAARVNAILVMADPATFDHRREIIDFSLANRIPTFHAFPEETNDGALAAYGQV
ncbi:MAG TPA: ABC transporter substrate-binding protein [Pseudolabrys sp.]|jgi:putative ABC transport system substrate-binding protein|nr:ABC transporter substrate-binding protein [Pseudolabrys sp.]